jgi:hypothetical protein
MTSKNIGNPLLRAGQNYRVRGMTCRQRSMYAKQDERCNAYDRMRV